MEGTTSAEDTSSNMEVETTMHASSEDLQQVKANAAVEEEQEVSKDEAVLGTDDQKESSDDHDKDNMKAEATTVEGESIEKIHEGATELEKRERYFRTPFSSDLHFEFYCCIQIVLTYTSCYCFHSF